MELVELTRELVSIPSHDDETAAGDAVEAWLRAETDAVVERDAVGNVIARRGGGRAGDGVTDGGGAGGGAADGGSEDDGHDESNPAQETLALVGHHDVVPPDDSQIQDGDTGVPEDTGLDPERRAGGAEYVVEQRDGRLYGRGTADMKGALAAMLLAFRDADLENGVADGAYPELVFASFVGEETGGEGARHAIAEGFAPDYAVVAEGSTNYSGPDVTDVAIAHKGRRASTITAHGAAAHASEPGAGENAIYRASDAVDAIRDLEAPSVTVAGERLEGSVVVTEIDGGSAWNVVPERCSVTVDERTVPGERAALERVEAIDGVAWAVDQDLPPMRCSDDAFADAVLAAADDAQPGQPALVTKPHATDAGWLAEAGTACVICGPAEPGEAHTADESVSIAVLERCRELYTELATRWPA